MADRRRRRTLEDEGEETVSPSQVAEVKRRPSECVRIIYVILIMQLIDEMNNIVKYCIIVDRHRDEFRWVSLILHRQRGKKVIV